MKKIVVGCVLLLLPVSGSAFDMIAGIKVPAGIGIVAPEILSTSTYTEFGVGGYLELSYSVIGIEVDFMYEKWGSWSSDSWVGTADVFRLPVLLKLKVGGTYLSAGPEFLFGDAPDSLRLGFSVGYELTLGKFLKLNMELPHFGVDWWDSAGTWMDFQARIGLGIKVH